MTAIRSPLARYAGLSRDPDPAAVKRLAEQGWHATGLIVLDEAWIESWGDREFVKAIAAKVHGKRREVK